MNSPIKVSIREGAGAFEPMNGVWGALCRAVGLTLLRGFVYRHQRDGRRLPDVHQYFMRSYGGLCICGCLRRC